MLSNCYAILIFNNINVLSFWRFYVYYFYVTYEYYVIHLCTIFGRPRDSHLLYNGLILLINKYYLACLVQVGGKIEKILAAVKGLGRALQTPSQAQLHHYTALSPVSPVRIRRTSLTG